MSVLRRAVASGALVLVLLLGPVAVVPAFAVGTGPGPTTGMTSMPGMASMSGMTSAPAASPASGTTGTSGTTGMTGMAGMNGDGEHATSSHPLAWVLGAFVVVNATIMTVGAVLRRRSPARRRAGAARPRTV